MKNNWEIKKIIDAFFIKPAKKEAREKLSGDDLVSFLPMEDLNILSKYVISNKERPLKSVEGSYTYFADNDVLLAKITPCFENGKLGIAQKLKNGIGFGSSEYIVFRTKGEVISEYLFYFLSQQKIRDEGKKVMTGAVGHKRVPKDFIENYLIPFPKEISEQKRIVSILDEVFADVEKAKVNAEKNLQNSKELFESYLQSVFSNKGDGWEEKKLSDLYRIGSSKRVLKSQWKNNGVPFYRGREITKIAKDGFVENDLFISEEHYLELSKLTGVPVANDIVITAIGTIGNAYIVKERDRFYFKDASVLWLKKDSDVSSQFIQFWLKSHLFFDQLNKGNGATVDTLTIQKLQNTYLYLPSKSEQEKIVKKLDELSTETKKLEGVYEQKLKDLEELKKSILQKAFNGEL